MIPSTQSLLLAQTYITPLANMTEDSLSADLVKGSEYNDSWLNKFNMFWKIKDYYQELLNFYPDQSIIKRSAEEYSHAMSKATTDGLAISAISILSIYQLARRGVVLPFLSQYGRYFKTHRVFRHYVWAAVGPVNLLWFLTNREHIDNCSQLWKVHSKRLSTLKSTFEYMDKQEDDSSQLQQLKGLLDESVSAINPRSEESVNIDMGLAYLSQYIYPLDLQNKLNNEVPLSEAPDYTNPEFEAVEVPEAEGEGDGDAEEDEE